MKQSAGLLVFRNGVHGREVLLGHMGGPFWSRKDRGAWTIPKGEIMTGETPLQAAVREFIEETGITPSGGFVALSPVKQAGGKLVHAWALEMDCDLGSFKSNTVKVPTKTGRYIEFPELDRLLWFPLEKARAMILPGQIPLLDNLARVVLPGTPE